MRGWLAAERLWGRRRAGFGAQRYRQPVLPSSPSGEWRVAGAFRGGWRWWMAVLDGCWRPVFLLELGGQAGPCLRALSHGWFPSPIPLPPTSPGRPGRKEEAA